MGWTKKGHPRRHRHLTLCLLGAGVLLMVPLCAGVGAVRFSLREIVAALMGRGEGAAGLLIGRLRLPRILCGGLVGLCLALSGCLLQGVMQNDMASPATIGVTGGAGFWAYVIVLIFPGYAHLLPVAAVCGALLTTLVIYALAYGQGARPLTLILCGLAVSALYGAGSDFIRTFYADSLGNVSGFLVGNLSGAGWRELALAAPYALAGMGCCLFLPARMNVMMLGEETASALGLKTLAFRLTLMIISSLLSGAAIAVAGLVSFVGLMAPHMARLLVGADRKYWLPASALLGALLVMGCDTLGRVMLPQGEMPVSVILALLGVPFFLYLLRTRERRG